MSNTNKAWNQGTMHAKTGKGPSNFSNKPYQVRQTYVTAYNAAKTSAGKSTNSGYSGKSGKYGK